MSHYPMYRKRTKIPASAFWLGGLGALPFVGLAAAQVFVGDVLGPELNLALVAYGALILSFLGGVRWGIAMSESEEGDERSLAIRLAISILPSLIGWSAFFMPDRVSLLILAIAFIAIGTLDVSAYKLSDAPAWYRKLRLPLTVTVTICLAIAAVAQA